MSSGSGGQDQRNATAPTVVIGPTRPLSPPQSLPDKLGCYRLGEVLGRGGMGVVYKGWDENLERHVALKIIAPEIAADELALARLKAEAQAAAQLHHHHIVSIYTFGNQAGWPYIAMEFVEGEDLSALIKREGPLTPGRAVRAIRQAAEALSYAAHRNIIHRDIKPSNIFMTKADEAKVMDFGLAKRLDVDVNLTTSGSVIGTPSYMSPEQAMGKGTDPRTDMYSLGCTLFSLLSGGTPYEATTPLEMMMRHVNEPLPIPPHWESIGAGKLTALIRKLAAKKPEERYASWTVALDDIRELERELNAPLGSSMRMLGGSLPGGTRVAGAGGRNRMILIAAALAVAAVAIGGAAWYFLGSGGRPTAGRSPIAAQPIAAKPTQAVSPIVPPAIVANIPQPAGQPGAQGTIATPIVDAATAINQMFDAINATREDVVAAATIGDWPRALDVLAKRPTAPGGPISSSGPIGARLEQVALNTQAALRVARDVDAKILRQMDNPAATIPQRSAFVENSLRQRGNTMPMDELWQGMIYLSALDSPAIPNFMQAFVERANRENFDDNKLMMLSSLHEFYKPELAGRIDEMRQRRQQMMNERDGGGQPPAPNGIQDRQGPAQPGQRRVPPPPRRQP